ncbi:TerB family tellurite resistance protein [Azohydromonas caseinilytica]|uniref:TerB family tellurite resistance protein n=1 Tax=Azohydromonas caseinilytica TaxID=2728836 RepID=A0A848FFW2_9BURK|nr:TerB family tellurite resistance protein [Azohydromonas caseinilytica]NML18328.1 TerB family tellurite resistance protein [Azohydromonas caseinilytica]
MSRHTIASRAYPLNSPQAAGRLVALALIANGEIKAKEWAALSALRACEQLGLSDEHWHDLLDELCHDLLASPDAAGDCLVDAPLLACWLAEVDDPALQHRVMRLCAAVIGADGHVDPGESVVLRGMLAQWVLPQEEQAGVEPLLYGLDFQVQPRRPQPVAG